MTVSVRIPSNLYYRFIAVAREENKVGVSEPVRQAIKEYVERLEKARL